MPLARRVEFTFEFEFEFIRLSVYPIRLEPPIKLGSDGEEVGMSVEELKNSWNSVLDYVESRNRITWLAYFDARLVCFDGKTLSLSFVDAEKLGGEHNYKSVRKPEQVALLKEAIRSVLNLDVEVIEI